MSTDLEKIERRVSLDERLQGIEEQLSTLNKDALDRVSELIHRTGDLEDRVFALVKQVQALKVDLMPVAPWINQINCPKCGRKAGLGSERCKHCQTAL